MTTNVEQRWQRIDALRDQMRSERLDVLLIYSQKRGHVPYISGYRPNYHTNSAFIIFPLDDQPVLLIKFGFDAARARELSWIKDIRAGESECLRGQIRECRGILEEKKLEQGRIGLVATDETMDELSLSMFRLAQAEFPKAQLELASDLINKLRMEKSSAEICALTRSTQLAETAVSALQHELSPSSHDFNAWAAAEFSAKTEGAEVCDLIISTGCSRLALPPSGAKFAKGESVACELTLRYQGYWTQICRTFHLGTPSVGQKKIFKACYDSYEAALNECRPGRPVSGVAQAAIATINRAGFPDAIKYGLGHGIGLDLPEPHSVTTNSEAVLGNDMVLVVHVGAWVPDIGSAFIGGPIVVRGTGVEVLDHPQTGIIEL
jgi:Xaa-Pro dipeptidase